MSDRSLPAPGRRLPVSTYRLQLGPDLGFDDARDRLPYLERLGITDLYLSPILAAAPGSTHGYDVVDHSRLSEVMGGRASFEALASAAHARGIGVLVDVVPNHMAVPTPAWHNRELWSVLAGGPASEFADWFDVEWDGAEPTLLMPVLGARIGAVLASGDLVVEQLEIPERGRATVLRYFDHVFPVRAGTEHLPLAELVDRQHYRLADWRIAADELNYRRFFDVGTLAAIRVEREEVFDATHALLLELMDAGHIDALRIDHPDGLADPRGYLRMLSERAGGAWIAAEKILEPSEELPTDWPVAGTTGYDAAWRINQVLTDPAGSTPLGTLMHELTGDAPGSLPALVEASKRQIVSESLHTEVHRLAEVISEVCNDDIRLRDHTFRAIRRCVAELVIAIDQYRAYVVPGETAPAVAVQVVRESADRARERIAPERWETLDLVVELLLGREAGSAGRVREPRRDEIIVRFQQVCGAVMAKGVEDTAFYRWTHLTSLCEVGGSPQTFAIAPDALHAWATKLQEAWPASMTAGSTHDAKRGADVRARIGVLSEYAQEWAALVGELREATSQVRPADLDGRTEALTWQTLAGTWTHEGPLAGERLADYLVKASREAKVWTRWTSPDAPREESLRHFALALGSHGPVARLMTAWAKRTAPAVRAATLSQVLLQLTLPGVADVYQGTETTAIALVDPDNRRPVDHARLSAMLDAVERAPGAWEFSDLAHQKLAVVRTALLARRSESAAMVSAEATYAPLPTSTGHALAFARGDSSGPRLVTVATRLARQLAALGGWGAHTLVLPEPAEGSGWVDLLRPGSPVLPAGTASLAQVLAQGPIAVLGVAS